MKTIQLDTRDIELLYSFPKPPADLQTIVYLFCFINRTAPPSFEELSSCLTKGQHAGIVQSEGKKFVISNDWYCRIHAADKTAANEIESMLEFVDQYLNIYIKVVTDTAFVPTKLEYESILAKLS